MEFVVALLPAVFFGFVGLILMGLGGNTSQQTLGQLSGGLFVAAAVAAIFGVNLPPAHLGIAFLSGVLLGTGIWLLVRAFHSIGVSRAMPITTGGQLVMVSLFGVVLFGEWVGTVALPVGIAGLAAVLAGVLATTYTEKQLASEGGPSAQDHRELDVKRGAWEIISATALLSVYVVMLRYFGIDPLEGFPPQAVGAALAGLLLTSPRFTPALGDKDTRWHIITVKSMSAGILWGLGVVIMQYSQILVGVAVGFSISQMGVVISTFGGILLLGEKRTRKEMWVLSSGVALLVAGAILLGVAKALDVP